MSVWRDDLRAAAAEERGGAVPAPRARRPRVFLLGGTSDAREIARLLRREGVEVVVSTLTEYGAALAGEGARHGKLDAEGIAEEARDCVAIMDATHPFAATITAEAEAAAGILGVRYLRYERAGGALPEGAIECGSHEEAAREAVRAAGEGGCVLLTVGTRALEPYAEACREAGVRCVARVLPVAESLAACEAAGVRPADIVAMQGPTTAALDEALLRHLGASVLVTKDSGEAGGVGEKAEAARRAGATLVVVARPKPANSGAAEDPQGFVRAVLAAIGEGGETDRRPPAPASGAGTARGASGAGTAPVLMVQGATSNAGKSVIAAALCRLLARRGLSVAPFKSQNMALNSAVTPDGAEIGRAQAYQAAAAGVEPTADMNPVLLKPCSSTGSQVIVLGKPVATMAVREYHEYQREVWPVVTSALHGLRERYDVVVAEGAGSPAEINLRDRDIANMRVALHAGAAVLLVVDIDRGGAFAHILGTLELLSAEERALVRGIVINRFRGDASLLAPGIEEIERRCGVPVLGVVPMLADWRGEEEDSLGLSHEPRPDADLTIVAIRLPYVSNYTDLDALALEPDVRVVWARTPADLDGADAIVLPGTKSTIADLAWLRETALAEEIAAAAGRGVPVVGVCGGFQMLGRSIEDPDGVESADLRVEGLGLLDVVTVFEPEKRTVRASGALTGAALASAGTPVAGYEIHMGRTVLGTGARPFATLEGDDGPLDDGAVSSEGVVCGTYLHGVFDSGPLRRAWLDSLRARRGLAPIGEPARRDDGIDRLADHVEAHLDVDRIVEMLGLRDAARSAVPPSARPAEEPR